jgi:hypothetical protein
MLAASLRHAIQQSLNFVLPWQSPDELIEMHRGVRCGEDIAVDAENLHVGCDAHWVYHREYTSAHLDPVPSETSVHLTRGSAPHRVAGAATSGIVRIRDTCSKMFKSGPALRVRTPKYGWPRVDGPGWR